MEEIIGEEELNQNIQNVIKSLSPEQIEEVLLNGANIMAEDIRIRAPIAKRGHYKSGTKVLVPPGNLKRSIVTKTMTRRGEKAAPALIAIDYRIAPHAHLVEYGTVRAAPHPFFRPGYDATKDAISEGITKDFKNLIESAPE